MSQVSIPQQFGITSENIPRSEEYLTLHFSPTAIPRQERWRNYGLSADFLGDYFSTFFPGDENAEQPISRRETIKASISYIANELLENAVKYSDIETDRAIHITLFLYEQEIIFQVVNYANQSRVEKYQSFIQKLLNSDLDDLYVQQLEQSALGSGESNLGMLTMLQDYSAKFGWYFEPVAESPNLTQVKVTVRLGV
ncbi:hypothetical protein C1752_06601 [Acaryochloris thomasi RCC1774]|uniref:ATP-binding protein n=1 Tax=Acaryochloris thomasi RCC1774 TaxID=1764569 RepID=A0A2W1JJX4_9CYAN|nr:DUF6272 family protein [Acaryochloris thomasi]PZD71322.1 hypothetical protein C1752_06601 [Acaryochloris thomasi RCC1774]